MQYNPRGTPVPPRSRQEIRHGALALLKAFEIESPCVDVARFLEHMAPRLDIQFSVVDVHALGALEEAKAFPQWNEIRIREDVYDRLCSADPRARFTVVHEVGHCVLKHGVGYARTTTAVRMHRPWEDSEWQADTFAAEFLMPVSHIQGRNISAVDIARQFGVSMDAAIIRRRVLRAEGLISFAGSL